MSKNVGWVSDSVTQQSTQYDNPEMSGYAVANPTYGTQVVLMPVS